MTTTLETIPRPASEAVKAFREYLSVHPCACEGKEGHDMDEMALELARIALDFQAPAPECLHQISEPAQPGQAPELMAAPESLQPGDVRPIVIGGTLCEDGRWWSEALEGYVDPDDCDVLPMTPSA